MRQSLRHNFRRATYADYRTTEPLCSATKNLSRTIKLALCNIKGELASSFYLNIARSQYFVVLMQ